MFMYLPDSDSEQSRVSEGRRANSERKSETADSFASMPVWEERGVESEDK